MVSLTTASLRGDKRAAEGAEPLRGLLEVERGDLKAICGAVTGEPPKEFVKSRNRKVTAGTYVCQLFRSPMEYSGGYL